MSDMDAQQHNHSSKDMGIYVRLSSSIMVTTAEDWSPMTTDVSSGSSCNVTLKVSFPSTMLSLITITEAQALPRISGESRVEV